MTRKLTISFLTAAAVAVGMVAAGGTAAAQPGNYSRMGGGPGFVKPGPYFPPKPYFPPRVTVFPQLGYNPYPTFPVYPIYRPPIVPSAPVYPVVPVFGVKPVVPFYPKPIYGVPYVPPVCGWLGW